MRFLARVLLAMLGFVGLLVVVGLVAGALVGRQEARLSEAWGATLVPLESFADRYPKAENNEAALKLARLGIDLGIDAAPQAEETRPKPAPAAEAAFELFAKAADGYVPVQLAYPDERIDPPPPPVAEFLGKHAAQVAALRAHLQTETPRWSVDLSRLFAAPIPRLLGIRRSARLLAADALVQIRQGHGAAAAADVEALARLGGALQERPDLIGQLIAAVALREAAGVARKLPEPPAGLPERLRALDPRKPFLLALEADSWVFTQFARGGVPGQSSLESARQVGSIEDGGSALLLVAAPVIRPYLRYCATDLSGRMRAVVEELQRQDPCVVAPAALERPEFRPAGWNTLGQVAMPNYVRSWANVTRLALDLELSAKVAQVKQLRNESLDGNWPATVPGVEKSATCPGGKWRYAVEPAGKMSLALDREPKLPPPQRVALPLAYSQDRSLPAIATAPR